MSRSVTIVNTSNWENEDIWVPGNSTKDSPHRLRPGECTRYTLYKDVSRYFGFTGFSEAEPEILHKDIDGEKTQLYPTLKVEFLSAEQLNKIHDEQAKWSFTPFRERYLI